MGGKERRDGGREEGRASGKEEGRVSGKEGGRAGVKTALYNYVILHSTYANYMYMQYAE